MDSTVRVYFSFCILAVFAGWWHRQSNRNHSPAGSKNTKNTKNTSLQILRPQRGTKIHTRPYPKAITSPNRQLTNTTVMNMLFNNLDAIGTLPIRMKMRNPETL